jgi:proteasome lid subunit RPN8/RPN11
VINPATYLLTPEIKRQIAAHAESDRTHEVCGVVADSKVIRCRNAMGALTPEQIDQLQAKEGYLPEFLIDPADWLKVQASAVEIQAIYHSHWADEHPEHLSGADIQQSKLLKLPYLVHHVGFGGWDLYSPHYPHPYPLRAIGLNPKSIEFYLQLPWFYGRSDCWGLIVDYYRGMLGIDIGDTTRDKDPRRVYTREWDRYRQELPDHGFIHLPDGTPYQDHDLILMRVNNRHNPEHLGVMVDAKKLHMLHHPGEPRLSSRELFGGQWFDANRSYGVYRHKELM